MQVPMIKCFINSNQPVWSLAWNYTSVTTQDLKDLLPQAHTHTANLKSQWTYTPVTQAQPSTPESSITESCETPLPGLGYSWSPDLSINTSNRYEWLPHNFSTISQQASVPTANGYLLQQLKSNSIQTNFRGLQQQSHLEITIASIK